MNNLTKSLPEIIFSSSNPSESAQISKLLREEKITKIAPRIYSGNLNKSPEVLIKENWRKIVAHFYPYSVISHKTAFTGGRIIDGTVFVTTNTTRTVNLPGLSVRLLTGINPIQYDMPLPEKNLYMSSEPRYLLENLQTSRQSKTIKKSVEHEDVELYLEKIIRNRGEDVINEIRDKAKEISNSLHMSNEFKVLDAIIGALLSTRNDVKLLTATGKKRSIGSPFDPDRVKLFEKLFNFLRNAKTYQPRVSFSEDEWMNSAFYDAYFSNHIEGTDFLIDEAKSIVFDGEIINGRISDSHDVLDTYRVLNNHTKMMTLPEDSEHFIFLLKQRHNETMGFRNEINPGEFKDKNNRAGLTEFVNYDLVEETLKQGYNFYIQLDKGFQRAAYIMFLISEVHPFIDGNGRISRIFMNAEMISSQHMRIIIPTVFRDDYLLALRRLSRESDPVAFLRMLNKATTFSSRINFKNIDTAQRELERSNAFKLPNEGILRIPNEGSMRLG